MAPRALVFGEALVDVFPDREVLGGAPMNVAVHLARAGWRTSLLSRVGDDPRGARIRALLEAEGVDQALLQVGPEESTGWVEVELSAGGEPSYTIHEGVAWDRIQPPSEVPEVDLVYYGSLAARAPESRAALEVVLEAPAAWRALDVNLRQDYWSPERVQELAGRARVLKLNEDELETLGECLGVGESPAGAFERFPDLEVLCVTRGSEGAELWERQGPVHRVGVPEVEVVDTVGAGDAFCAHLLSGLVTGTPPEEALEQAARAAGEVVGCRGALPPRGEDP